MARYLHPVIINTRPLSVGTVKVFSALFKAQLPDTLEAIRRLIPEWNAVRRKWDPDGRLMSAQSVRVLGDLP